MQYRINHSLVVDSFERVVLIAYPEVPSTLYRVSRMILDHLKLLRKIFWFQWFLQRFLYSWAVDLLKGQTTVYYLLDFKTVIRYYSAVRCFESLLFIFSDFLFSLAKEVHHVCPNVWTVYHAGLSSNRVFYPARNFFLFLFYFVRMWLRKTTRTRANLMDGISSNI